MRALTSCALDFDSRPGIAGGGRVAVQLSQFVCQLVGTRTGLREFGGGSGNLLLFPNLFFCNRGGQAINFSNRRRQFLDPHRGFSHLELMSGNSRRQLFSLNFQTS